jgi:L-ascorbate metabolism protein UlaG (beta-lactamase superfamily)
MKIHHLRNATFVIESGEKYILIDPMLCDKGKLPPFARLKHKPKKNPLVSLPDNAIKILDKVTNCLLTHSQKYGIKALQHTDHLDTDGETFLRDKNIPIVTRKQDASYLIKKGLTIEFTLTYWRPSEYCGGMITAVPALHGHGWIQGIMANGAGFYLHLPDEPSIYISGDTLYTRDVERVLIEFEPDIAVMASGSASLDVGGPILMTMEELITFAKHAPGKVVANHLEALNHCPTTRSKLKRELERNGFMSKVYIPKDGDVLNFESD